MEKRPKVKGTARPRPKKKPLNPKQLFVIKQLFRGVLLFAAIGLLITGVWYLTRLEALTVKNIEVVGGKTIPHEEVSKVAEDALAGEYFRLIPKRFSYTYPQEEIITRINGFDRVKNATVDRLDRKTLQIVYEEYVPFALWCEPGQIRDCFFIDRSGFAFTKAPELSGGALVRYESIGTAPRNQTQAFSSEHISDTKWLTEQLQDTLGLYVVSIAIDIEDDVFVTLSGGGELKLSLREKKEATLENLITILQSDNFSHIEPGNFQYIDLRFGNKVFVNEELPSLEVATSTATTSEEIIISL